MPSNFTTTLTSPALLQKHFAGEEGKRQLLGGASFRFRNFDFVVKKEADTGRLQVALKNVDVAPPAEGEAIATSSEGEAVLTEVTRLLDETISADEKQVRPSERAAEADAPTASDTVGAGPTDAASKKKPQFRSLAEVKTYLCRSGSAKTIAEAGGFEIGSRQFTLETVHGTHGRITENNRSWVQAILSLFSLDDVSILIRTANRHTKAQRSAQTLRKKIEAILGSRISPQQNVDGLPAYLNEAIGSMGMAPGAQRWYLQNHIDDPFFCTANFSGIEPTDNPAVFRAVFRSDTGHASIALSNYSEVKVKGHENSAGLQGEVLQSRLKNTQYGSLHELVRRWEAEQLAARLQAEVDSACSGSPPGMRDLLKDTRYRCDGMPEGYFFRIDKNLRFH
ncbi:hypothetical protein [Paracidovorax citrulli]